MNVIYYKLKQKGLNRYNIETEEIIVTKSINKKEEGD